MKSAWSQHRVNIGSATRADIASGTAMHEHERERGDHERSQSPRARRREEHGAEKSNREPATTEGTATKSTTTTAVAVMPRKWNRKTRPTISQSKRKNERRRHLLAVEEVVCEELEDGVDDAELDERVDGCPQDALTVLQDPRVPATGEERGLRKGFLTRSPLPHFFISLWEGCAHRHLSSTGLTRRERSRLIFLSSNLTCLSGYSLVPPPPLPCNPCAPRTWYALNRRCARQYLHAHHAARAPHSRAPLRGLAKVPTRADPRVRLVPAVLHVHTKSGVKRGKEEKQRVRRCREDTQRARCVARRGSSERGRVNHDVLPDGGDDGEDKDVLLGRCVHKLRLVRGQQRQRVGQHLQTWYTIYRQRQCVGQHLEAVARRQNRWLGTKPKARWLEVGGRLRT